MEKKCATCKKSVSNSLGSVEFMCPNCNKYKIVRCAGCRKLAAKYACPGCGFEGPN